MKITNSFLEFTTYCPALKQQIRLSLADCSSHMGITSGKPSECNMEEKCVHRGKVRCLLIACKYGVASKQ